jgi:hypothetical protein
LAQRPVDQPKAREQAAEIYQQLWKHNQAVRTMKGAAMLRMSRGVFSRAAEEYIVVQRPEQLRIDSYTVFGQLLYQIIYSKGVLYIYDAQAGAARSSDDVRQLLNDELSINMEPADMLLLLSGGLPLESPDNYLAVRQSSHILLRGLTSQILFDPVNGRPLSYMAQIPGGGLYKTEFSDYREIEGFAFPYRVKVTRSDVRIGLDIEYSGVELNDPIDPKLFRPPALIEAGLDDGL